MLKIISIQVVIHSKQSPQVLVSENGVVAVLVPTASVAEKLLASIRLEELSRQAGRVA